MRDARAVHAAQQAQRVDEIHARAWRTFVKRHAWQIAAADDLAVEGDQTRDASLSGERGERRGFAGRKGAGKPTQRGVRRARVALDKRAVAGFHEPRRAEGVHFELLYRHRRSRWPRCYNRAACLV